MKKYISNPRFLHFFYLSAIALTWFLTWYIFPNPSMQCTLKGAKQQLSESNEISKTLARHLQWELKDQVYAYPNLSNLIIGKKADSIIALTDTLLVKIEKCSQNGLYENIETLKNGIVKYDEISTKMIDEYNLKEFSKSNLKKILQNNDFWQRLDATNKAEQQTQFEVLKNIISNNKIDFLSYFERESGSSRHEYMGVMIGISPSVGAIKAGDIFKADAMFISYINNPADFLSIKIDGKEIPMKEGVAHFEKRYHNVGKRSIRVEGVIQNLLTNQKIQTQIKEFSFEVLPK